MLKWLKNLFQKSETVTVTNCEVFIHKHTAELYLINEKGLIEGNVDLINTDHMESLYYDKDSNTAILTLNRAYFEYLGEL